MRIEDDGSAAVLIRDDDAIVLAHPTNIAFRGSTAFCANLGPLAPDRDRARPLTGRSRHAADGRLRTAIEAGRVTSSPWGPRPLPGKTPSLEM